MAEPTRITLRTPLTPAAPFWQCARVFGDNDCAFLLDSALEQGPRSRFSFLGGRPAALLTGWRGPDGSRDMALDLQTWRLPDGSTPAGPEVEHLKGDPFAVMRDLQARYAGQASLPADPPFTAGLVGYFGYETAHAIENLPVTGTTGLPVPDLAFMVADEVLVRDHERETTTLHVTRGGPTARAEAEAATAWWQSRLAQITATPPSVTGDAGPTEVRAHFDREQYMAAVSRCREHILQGDLFEVCLTHQLAMDLPGSAWDLYAALRQGNPAPFAAYLQLPDCRIVSASPERFLRLDRDGLAESRPIKGTRPRGQTPAADERLRTELAQAEKDCAENIMIVDLVRNDLGRVCRFGSVEVTELQQVETYATVHQLVSAVQGRLRPDYDAFDLVRACFPGGSMTGAPKIEAMKVIDAIEPVKRGIYSGALGYLAAGGAMDLGMVIRTIVCRDGVASFGVGGAVVADSDPAAEYEETMDKARALIRAVAGLNRGGQA